eukprot:CAMPEP_0117507918 /NCGR_PEP_ID=MMETSP0784-20121206/26673_1 /TAXON_ID=39447 /ORGANISM="" /LENGTH=728 /DNA_ID=CAMNT_0005303441 /DNA_START=36 /DNA_END=2222 /DNA_ORIENTATION=+
MSLLEIIRKGPATPDSNRRSAPALTLGGTTVPYGAASSPNVGVSSPRLSPRSPEPAVQAASPLQRSPKNPWSDDNDRMCRWLLAELSQAIRHEHKVQREAIEQILGDTFHDIRMWMDLHAGRRELSRLQADRNAASGEPTNSSSSSVEASPRRNVTSLRAFEASEASAESAPKAVWIEPEAVQKGIDDGTSPVEASEARAGVRQVSFANGATPSEDLEQPQSEATQSALRNNLPMLLGIGGEVRRTETDTRSELKLEESNKWKRHIRDTFSQQHHTASSRLVDTLSGLLGRRWEDRRSWLGSKEEQPIPSWLGQVVDGTAFNIGSSLVVLANAALVGMEQDLVLRGVASAYPPPSVPILYSWLQNCFLLAFIVEVGLRMAALRWRFFFGGDRRWNIFDLCLLVYSVAAEVSVRLTDVGPNGRHDMTSLRVLRGLRVVRAIRVIRRLRCFTELRLMVCSIVQSLTSFAWALALLGIILYLFAISISHGVARAYYLNRDSPLVLEDLRRWYGSIGDTMYTLLLAISGGQDWGALVEPISKESAVYQATFAFYVVFVLLCVLNVLTSVFVERARELSSLDRDLIIQSALDHRDACIREMRDIFVIADRDGSGYITWEEFRDYLQNDEVRAFFATQKLDTSEAYHLFQLLDMDDSGSVSIEEFIMGFMQLKGEAKSADIAIMLRETRAINRKLRAFMRATEMQLRILAGSALHCGPQLTAVSSGAPKASSSE